MATVADTISQWLDHDNYPPRFDTLPGQLTLAGDGIGAAVADLFRQSSARLEEVGAGIGFIDGHAKSLALGTVEWGAEDTISVSARKTPMHSFPIGDFHTHPHADGFFAPSPPDITSFAHFAARDRTILSLVVSPPATNPWFYLLIATKEMLALSPNIVKFKQQISDDIQRSTGESIPRELTTIQNEMAQHTNDLDVDPAIPKNIAYEKTLIDRLRKFKIGFYSGLNGNLTKRN